jgi:hypothetical protein
MHQLPGRQFSPGLLFAAGSVLIFLLAIPALWYVVAGAVAFGLVVAAILQFARSTPRGPASICKDEKVCASNRGRVLKRIHLD